MAHFGLCSQLPHGQPMALGVCAVERENTSNRETTSMLACILLLVSEEVEVEAHPYPGFPIRWAFQALENYTQSPC
jgi:hypothetical protein